MTRRRALAAGAVAAVAVIVPVTSAMATTTDASCANYVADPGGSGCTWSPWMDGFGEPIMSATVSPAPGARVDGHAFSAIAQGQSEGSFEIRSAQVLASRSQVRWRMSTVNRGADPILGEIRISAGLDINNATRGKASTLVTLALHARDRCVKSVMVTVPQGAAHQPVSLDITPSECPGLFAGGGNIDIDVAVTGVSHDGNSAFGATGRLRFVDIFFHSPGCFDGYGDACPPTP